MYNRKVLFQGNQIDKDKNKTVKIQFCIVFLYTSYHTHHFHYRIIFVLYVQVRSF